MHYVRYSVTFQNNLLYHSSGHLFDLLSVRDLWLPLRTESRAQFSELLSTSYSRVGRYRIRYSDWLRAGRSGYRIPVDARFSAPVQTGPGAHPASCTICTMSFPEVKSGRGVALTLHTLLMLWSRKSRAILYTIALRNFVVPTRSVR